MISLSGVVRNWKLGQNSRQWTMISVPYEKARKVFQNRPYKFETGEGEQRQVILSHARDLKKEMKEGRYTPTPISAHILDEKQLNFKGKSVHIDVEDPLPLTNGGHRFHALELLREQEEDLAEDIDKLPIDCTLYLEPEEAKQDFLNHQKGKAVSKTHILNLSVDSHNTIEGDSELFELARNMAKTLHEEINSHLYHQVNLDGNGSAPIQLSSLISCHASERAMNLYGTAMIAHNNERNEVWGNDRQIDIWQILMDTTPNLLESGKILCPPPRGKKRSANLLIGMGNMLAYRMVMLDQEKPTDEDIDIVVNAAQSNLDRSGTFGAALHRVYLGDFAVDLFADLENKNISNYHDGLPISLLSVFSGPALGRSAVPKERKVRGRPKKEIK